MADFQPALDFLLPHEGGYSKDFADPGGETKYGISRRTYPDVDIPNLTVEDAAAIYKRDWWDKEPFADLNNQSIANKIFDLSVNMGVYEAVRLLQVACGDCGNPTGCDGNFGPMTVAAANACDPFSLLEALKNRAVNYYKTLAMKKPSSAKFLNGWLRRAEA